MKLSAAALIATAASPGSATGSATSAKTNIIGVAMLRVEDGFHDGS